MSNTDDELIIGDDGPEAKATPTGFKHTGARTTDYTPELALAICVMIADGYTLVQISNTPGMPKRSTVYKWLSLYPKFFDAYERAKEVSAQAFEEEALTMARELKSANDFTGTKVQAYNIAMGQLRWSASRRDKARYGQQVQVASMVPIQINTTLNLGQEGQPAATDIAQSIYTVTAEVVATPAQIEGNDDQNVDAISGYGEVLDLSATGEEDEAAAFGVTKTPGGNSTIGARKLGRPKKGPRKSAAETQRAMTRLANKAKKDV